MAAVTRDRLVVRVSGEQSARWLVERSIGGDLGMLSSLFADSEGLWVGGERGFARYHLEARQFSFVNSPGDIPGRVHDLAADDRYLWVATDGGVVRFEKRAVEGR